MPEKELILTYEGLQKLEEELEYLKTTKKMEVAERIKEARGFGDFSEEFHKNICKIQLRGKINPILPPKRPSYPRSRAYPGGRTYSFCRPPRRVG